MWQDERAARLAKMHGGLRVAIHQENFGTPFPKPIGLMGTLEGLADLGVVGWPRYDPDGNYTGPLPEPENTK